MHKILLPLLTALLFIAPEAFADVAPGCGCSAKSAPLEGALGALALAASVGGMLWFRRNR